MRMAPNTEAKQWSYSPAVQGDEIEVNLGRLDAPDQFVPTYELWTKRREEWLPEFSVENRYEGDRA